MAEEWGVEYPVDFRSGGDTTKDAFHKHIQEIAAIYGKLNTLNNGKLDSTALSSLQTELTNHKDSTNPHPNWKISFSFNDLTGTLDGSKITGTLSGAKIPYGNITGLSEYLSTQITDSTNGLVGVKNFEMGEEKGQIIFTNNFTLKWGHVKIEEPFGQEGERVSRTVTFSPTFANKCLNVSLTCVLTSGLSDGNRNFMPLLQTKSKSDFTFSIEQADSNKWDDMAIEYFAIGY